MWHMIYDTWHVTCDTWREVNTLSKCQVPRSYGLGVKVSWRYFRKESVTELIYKWQRCLQNSPGYTGSVKYSKRLYNIQVLHRQNTFCLHWPNVLFPTLVNISLGIIFLYYCVSRESTYHSPETVMARLMMPPQSGGEKRKICVRSSKIFNNK